MLANKISEVTSEYSNAEVLIAGDLNARTKDFLDFIPDDNIDHVCDENNMYPGNFFCIPRKSNDLNTYNAYGCSLVELCCVFDVHIMNGRVSGDIEGDFMCYSNNDTSVVDYIVTSSNIFNKTILCSQF